MTKKKHISQSLHFLPLLLLLFLLSFGLFLYQTPAPSKSPIVETDSTDQKTIPHDIRNLLKQAVPGATYRVPVLLYHYVEYVKDQGDTIRQSLDVTPDVFTKQVQTLVLANYTFLTASDLADILDNKMKIPEKPILLTFDDGYKDFYTDVWPILQKYHVKATIYVVPGFLDTSNYMSLAQLLEVAKSDLVEVAAHTMHHMYLKDLPAKTVESEVNKSKAFLEEKLGTPIISFAYPYGAFDKQAVEMVKMAGFKTGASTLPEVEVTEQTRYFFPRIRPGYRTGKDLLYYLEETKFTPLVALKQ